MMSRKVLIPLILFVVTTFVLFIRCIDCPPNTMAERLGTLKAEMTKLSSTLGESVFSLQNAHQSFVIAGTEVQDSTLFYSGSVSKQMTAYMVLESLQDAQPDEGLDLAEMLGQPLMRVFPNSKILKSINKPWVHEVSVLDLLVHQSGLQDYVETNTLSKPLDPVEMMVRLAFDQTKPHRYSNTNFYLLSKLLEEFRMKPFDALFDEMIKIPAKMDDSFAPVRGTYTEFIKTRPLAKLPPLGQGETYTDFSNVLGAGGVVSSARDLHKWNHFLYARVSRSLYAILLKSYHQTPDGEVDLMALSLEKTKEGDLIGFQGHLDGYSCFLGWLPISKTSLVVLATSRADFDSLMSVLKSVLK